jgi:hypothetical protein
MAQRRQLPIRENYGSTQDVSYRLNITSGDVPWSNESGFRADVPGSEQILHHTNAVLPESSAGCTGIIVYPRTRR